MLAAQFRKHMSQPEVPEKWFLDPGYCAGLGRKAVRQKENLSEPKDQKNHDACTYTMSLIVKPPHGLDS